MTRTITAGKEKATKLVGAKAVVYAYADRGIAQHEAVHAYCGQTFGRTGPTWYSEGMAEMGQYWVKGSRAVNTPQQLVKFFREEYRHRQAIDIVNEEQITGDSWANYTRRWALCHLLNHNLNYSKRFRWIGKAIVTGQEINYPELFGARADQIEFEYQFFVKRIDIGYRVDLCSWDWEARFLPLAAKPKSVKISARRGWQPSKASLTAGQKYDYSAKGKWSTGSGEPVDAKGHQDGRGRLMGVLMKDFQLGEPFELGVYGTFTAPADGHLYLRCRDDWHEIEDNQDHIFVRLKGSDP
ncbi:MAG: hypothetical protein GTO26_02680 [Planctomycetales bacterium]|nr:hypothetical protein [Planctomycetales bacterium]NIO33899.1 hypothetical protein [Planctomycetales bacterium]NIO45707.1 hypothetical protein [Planctomycetales bacterium]NIP84545.1 hypothetical protein [Planctomycetales bacterium]